MYKATICILLAFFAVSAVTTSSHANPESRGELSTKPGVRADGASLSERECPPDSPVTYRSFGSGFLSNWCNGCHGSVLGEGQRAGAPLGVDFDTYEGAIQWIDRIYARSADSNQTMPPSHGPDEKTRRLLGDWLACGAQ